jgi:hypothetical protein
MAEPQTSSCQPSAPGGLVKKTASYHSRHAVPNGRLDRSPHEGRSLVKEQLPQEADETAAAQRTEQEYWIINRWAWSRHCQTDRRDARRPDLGGVDAGQGRDTPDGTTSHARHHCVTKPYSSMQPLRFIRCCRGDKAARRLVWFVGPLYNILPGLSTKSVRRPHPARREWLAMSARVT